LFVKEIDMEVGADGGAGMGGGLGFDEVPKRLKRGEREHVRMALGGG
jgi:hypothetical protein